MYQTRAGVVLYTFWDFSLLPKFVFSIFFQSVRTGTTQFYSNGHDFRLLIVSRKTEYAFIDWIFDARPRLFTLSCYPAICVDENLCFGKVKAVAGIYTVCCPDGRFHVVLPYGWSILLESSGDSLRGLPSVATGKVFAMDPANDRRLPARTKSVLSLRPLTSRVARRWSISRWSVLATESGVKAADF